MTLKAQSTSKWHWKPKVRVNDIVSQKYEYMTLKAQSQDTHNTKAKVSVNGIVSPVTKHVMLQYI